MMVDLCAITAPFSNPIKVYSGYGSNKNTTIPLLNGDTVTIINPAYSMLSPNATIHHKCKYCGNTNMSEIECRTCGAPI
jgi:hypothetical protein